MNASPVEILLVEDNPDDIELTLRAFERHKLSNRIHVARDGAEAIEFLFSSGGQGVRDANEGPRVILLDLKLPKISGLEVLREVKAHERLRRIPVVVLTSSAEEPDIAESYKLGANSYIVKPVDFDRFTEAVRELGLYWLLLNQPPVA
jgi:two-component system response regulator